ncbi:VOC family protein [Aureitalea marina]|uniref:VOC domain-containing protein n=1 Tax=Aureitalea marina TaxID=930804 RepID=A0A2S7KRY7_9FLAO|nr:VOC family protein [Aureitalea marina]PQB05392.1 hypothetical protein BST85_11200 [Aureitalea marina]
MKNLFLLLLISTQLAISQADQITFNHVALGVSDLESSTSFYTEILGIQRIGDPTNNETIRWFALGEGKELHLVATPAEFVRPPRQTHFAISSANFDIFVRKLRQKDVPFVDWEGKPNSVYLRPDGVRQIYLQDPDGYWIEVNSFTKE